MKKLYCYNCDKETEYEIKKESVHHYVHGVEFDVEQDVYYCKDCGEEIDACNLNEEFKLVTVGYLNYYGIRSLTDVRKKYNLSQELFAKILGWSKKSIVRYENGQSLPQKEYMSVYMYLNLDPLKLYSMIENKKDELKENYNLIINKIKDDELYKGVNMLLYILKQKILYRIQLMKNAFAIDTLAYKENNKPVTNFKYAHAPFGPVINNFQDLINAMIKYDYINFIFGDNDKPILNHNIEPNMSIFSKKEIEIMDEVIRKYKNLSSKDLSNISHKYKGWIETKNGEIIDYKYADFFEL